ncbi:TPA: LcrG family type III secretion system chaperone [Aeromonas veronii]|uniref:LcrG family type III secretion system chaperone n=1 Tax=Aeromonas veronii TaxID=654 RepID=UPI001F175BC9|nr:LcrG family type III secretion system chaperone [Aeromonas veronii]MCF5841313.1 LcrG family type III secretion system chaperone [Aeromonas veronii]HDO1382991.1 LcrG family type III secretion system chaperone [Aeromonas veronii]
MKQPRFADHSEAILQAEQAIADSDHRNALLQEMLAGLALSDQTCQLLFDAPTEQVAVAEQELLAEIQRRQASQPAQPGEGRKSRRPTMMRGLMI